MAERGEGARRDPAPAGRVVSIEYTVTLPDGSPVTNNVGGEPLVYKEGTGEVPPGLERAVSAVAAGERARFTLSPREGYGEHDPHAMQEVKAELVPQRHRAVGEYFMVEDAAGNPRPIRVVEVRGEKIVLDLNHPLAGRTLVFDVRVLEVSEPGLEQAA